MPSQTHRAYRFDDCVVDVSAFQVWKADAPLALEPKSIKVLHYLVENRARLVPKEELIQAVWGQAFVTDNALTRVIAQLRKALGDNAKQARYIETVPTQGYRFIVAVEEVAPPEPVAPPSNSPVRDYDPPPPPPRRRWSAWVAFAALLLTVNVAGWLWREHRSAAGEAGPSPGSIQFTSSSGLEVTPAFSPDGNAVAYASDKGGSFEIYVKPLEPGAREIKVTSDGMQNVQPAWSPDGRSLAFYSVTRGGIYVVPATGGFPRLLTDGGSEPAWSPDGKWIAFRSGGFTTLAPPDLLPQTGSRIWVVAAAGGEPRRLTGYRAPRGPHGTPSWTPDGKVLFAAYDQRSEFWTVTLDGTLTRVPSGRGSQGTPAMSPDAKSIYAPCVTRDLEFGICRTDLSTGATKEVFWSGLMAARGVQISRDGSRLAYSLTSMTSNLWSLPVDDTGEVTGQPMQLTEDSSFRNSLPAISPDGRRIAYMVRRKGTLADVYLIEPDGSSEQITKHPSPEMMPTWTPDGAALVYASRRDGTNKLWKLSLAGGSESILSDTPLVKTMARMSPDGRTALFHQYDEWRLATYRMPVATGKPVRLSPEGESMGYPCWSRNGKWVAVERAMGEYTEAGIIPASGGTYRPITRQKGQHWIYSWSPDSSMLAVAALRGGTWNIWRTGLDGTEKQLTNYKSLRSFVRYPEWSPAGDRIVFEFAESRGNIYLMDLARP